MLKLIIGILLMLGGLFFGFVAFMGAGGMRNFDRSRLLRGDELTMTIIACGVLFVGTIVLATRKKKAA